MLRSWEDWIILYIYQIQKRLLLGRVVMRFMEKVLFYQKVI